MARLTTINTDEADKFNPRYIFRCNIKFTIQLLLNKCFFSSKLVAVAFGILTRFSESNLIIGCKLHQNISVIVVKQKLTLFSKLLNQKNYYNLNQ